MLLKSIVNNLAASLQSLEFTIKPKSLYVDELSLCRRLTRLDFSNSFCDSRKMAVLLNQLRSLTYLDLSSAENLNDDLFTSLPIHAPLEHLDISCLNDITDLSLNALVANSSCLAKSLKKLEIACCTRLTSGGILKLIESLPGLEYLNISFIDSIYNSFLHNLSCVTNHQGKMHIRCHFIDLDVDGFMRNKPDEVISKIQLNAQYEITYKNFTIEVDI